TDRQLVSEKVSSGLLTSQRIPVEIPLYRTVPDVVQPIPHRFASGWLLLKGQQPSHQQHQKSQPGRNLHTACTDATHPATIRMQAVFLPLQDLACQLNARYQQDQ